MMEEMFALVPLGIAAVAASAWLGGVLLLASRAVAAMELVAEVRGNPIEHEGFWSRVGLTPGPQRPVLFALLLTTSVAFGFIFAEFSEPKGWMLAMLLLAPTGYVAYRFLLLVVSTENAVGCAGVGVLALLVTFATSYAPGGWALCLSGGAYFLVLWTVVFTAYVARMGTGLALAARGREPDAAEDGEGPAEGPLPT
jgi:hypothetical protein